MPVAVLPPPPAPPPCDQTPTITFSPSIFSSGATIALPYTITGYSDPPSGRTIDVFEVYLNGTRSVLTDTDLTNPPRFDFRYEITESMCEEPGLSNALTFMSTDSLGCRTTYSTSFRT